MSISSPSALIRTSEIQEALFRFPLGAVRCKLKDGLRWFPRILVADAAYDAWYVYEVAVYFFAYISN
ncbi:hypothetical protein KSB_02200 [Ktedonobacter robiniae]|uniref:IS5/IS1182 family transposase n=1 Tax=Ktedonobacter robiniae TaxID=2778365 RepID=A0ABQ3UH50_9CHLR|nr:hypothetical protein KSB_02200 [Ktedonobacter robiniae]